MDRTRSAAFNQGPVQDEHIKIFATRRMTKWTTYFEKALTSNLGGAGFMLGSSLSYVDLCIFHVLNGLEFQLPQAFQDLRIPHLKALQRRIHELPRVRDYIQSPRCKQFTGTGPTF
mmetsp:Transcript_38804/g.72827  ORF Transcript_38804/g.72827 Transcript_38804/m.72827 type:complete len:116 (+) Transcript_38804:2076-2423(+)